MVSFLSEPHLIVAILELTIGLVCLIKAANLFVEGSSQLAKFLQLSPVLVGVVIVGFGTSAPEMLVSGLAAAGGELSLGVGNVVGSNVANLSLVLGSAALFIPVVASEEVKQKEMPLSLFAVVLFAGFTLGGLAMWEGLVMLALLAGALLWLLRSSRDAIAETSDEKPTSTMQKAIFLTVLGLIGTICSAQALVWGATAVSAEAGLSGGFVGFTLLAVGTSLPELSTAISAARRGEAQLLLGNLLGSNMFNSLGVGGVIALAGPGVITDRSIATLGVVSMIVVAALAVGFMMFRNSISRAEAVLLLAVWLGTVIYMA